MRASSIYDNEYTYTGRRLDKETGIYQYPHRVYAAGLGRFCSRDPIGLTEGQTVLQEYVVGNPIRATDPYGLKRLGQKWEVPDFFWWYYSGTGQVPLDEVGLLIPWWNHIKPQIYHDLKTKMVPGLEGKSDCYTGKTSGVFDVGPFNIHVVAGGGITDPLTVMGNSQVKVRGKCSIEIDCQKCCNGSVEVSQSSGSCDLDFSVADRFQNPLDWGGHFAKKDWPGATPYALVASWFHVYKWDYWYNPCEENQ